MSSPKPSEPPPPVKLDFVAALLSYLIPGLGQLTQGRVRKGLLFLVCLYALFFYGMYLGQGKNVYLPYNHPEEKGTLSRLASDLYTRFQFVGQFPIGMAAWPAVYQYYVYAPDDPKPPLNGWMRAPNLDEINQLQRDGDKTWDLGWVYTVIAGVLNVLVVYDAMAGPAFRETKAPPPGGAA
jgi:Family of unknown function (DUF6677)